MTRLITQPNVRIIQDDQTTRTQLQADVEAVTAGASSENDSYALVTRPSILRRLAAKAAVHVPPQTDRILTASGADAQFGTALALHCGVPHVVVDEDKKPRGELHSGERVALATLFIERGEQLQSNAIALGCTILVHISAIGHSDEGATPPSFGVLGSAHRVSEGQL